MLLKAKNANKPAYSISFKTASFFALLFLLLSIFIISFGSSLVTKFYSDSKKELMRSISSEIISSNFNNHIFKNNLRSFEDSNYSFIIISKNNNKIIYNSPNLSIDNNIKISDNLYDISGFFDVFNSSDDKAEIDKLTGVDNSFAEIAQTKDYMVITISLGSEFKLLDRRYRGSFSGTAIALTMILVIISVLFINYLISPLKEVLKTLSLIKNKDFSARCDVSTKDEIGLVANSVDDLAFSLGKYSKQLNIANNKLRQDIERRKQVEESQKSFISSMSHEIKTPVSIISGYAEALKYGIAETPEEMNEYCDSIIAECNRITSLSKQLLDLARAENSDTQLNYSDFNIRDLCNSVVDSFKLKAQSLNLTIRKEYFCDKTISADYEALKTVLVNFMQNACRYTPDGGMITVRIRPVNKKIKVAVENTGSHIDKEDIDKIWDRFYKVDKSHSRDGNSTGLGLSICKAIINLHHGEYGCKNKGNGVEFFFILSDTH